ncbi:uncharacterized protein [Bombus flavifrons]|uniref:uncharacterized protein n=1 Tax=Bombus flavifrons TaxID=103934 RepID=UPI0037046DBE
MKVLNTLKVERQKDLQIVEEENFLKVCRNKKRMRIFSSPDSADKRMSIPSTSQNVMVRMIFKDIAGPTGYAKRNIMSGCVTSALELIIDRHIMEHIKDCTEIEAHQILKKDRQSQLLSYVVF